MPENPYRTPRLPNEEATGQASGHPTFVFVGLGTLTLIVCSLATASCFFATDIIPIAVVIPAMSPIAMTGGAAVWHGIKPSSRSTKALAIALVALTVDMTACFFYTHLSR